MSKCCIYHRHSSWYALGPPNGFGALWSGSPCMVGQLQLARGSLCTPDLYIKPPAHHLHLDGSGELKPNTPYLCSGSYDQIISPSVASSVVPTLLRSEPAGPHGFLLPFAIYACDSVSTIFFRLNLLVLPDVT